MTPEKFMKTGNGQDHATSRKNKLGGDMHSHKQLLVDMNCKPIYCPLPLSTLTIL